MDPPRPPQRALGRYRGTLSRRMPSYRPPAPMPDPVRRAYERAWSDVPDPDEDAYAAGVAWGSASPPPAVAAPPDEEEDDDDDFDWSDHGEEGGGPQMQEALKPPWSPSAMTVSSEPGLPASSRRRRFPTWLGR